MFVSDFGGDIHSARRFLEHEGEEPDPETWGTSAEALAAQAEMERMIGGPTA